MFVTWSIFIRRPLHYALAMHTQCALTARNTWITFGKLSASPPALSAGVFSALSTKSFNYRIREVCALLTRPASLISFVDIITRGYASRAANSAGKNNLRGNPFSLLKQRDRALTLISMLPYRLSFLIPASLAGSPFFFLPACARVFYVLPPFNAHFLTLSRARNSDIV